MDASGAGWTKNSMSVCSSNESEYPDSVTMRLADVDEDHCDVHEVNSRWMVRVVHVSK